MKINKSTLSAIILATAVCTTNISIVNAQGMLEEKDTNIQVECPNNNCQKPCPCKIQRRSLLMQSVQELQKDGTLSKQDVQKIKEFRKKEREEMKQRILQSQCKKVDQMVKEKVITKQQGIKLKQTMEKNLNNLEKECN